MILHRSGQILMAVRKPDPDEVRLRALAGPAITEVGMNDEVLNRQAPIEAKEPIRDPFGKQRDGIVEVRPTRRTDVA
jgi:hypothetical protein